MNIDELEKLNALKEKGILTQEEFDTKKKELLNREETNSNAISPKRGINWKNFFLSSLVAAGYCAFDVIFLIFSSYSLSHFDSFFIENLLMNTLGVWAFTYLLLQVELIVKTVSAGVK